GDLNEKAGKLAALLVEKGIDSGRIVGLMVERSFEMIIGILAVLKAGGACLPIDPDYPENRKTYMLEDSRISLLLTAGNRKKAPYIPEVIEIIDIGDKNAYDRQELSVERGVGSDLLYVIYTSGSTGKPKGVMLEHGNLVNLLNYQYKYTNIDFSRVLQFATISFDVSFQEIFSTLLAVGRLYLITGETRNDIHRLFTVVAENGIKTLFFPAAYLKFIFAREDYSTQIPGSVDHIVTAGEQVVINDSFRECLRKNKIYLHNHYGPSETHVVTTLSLEPLGEIPGLPSIGIPISNTAIYILDRAKQLLPVGAAGELYIAGAQLGRGYLDRPELTAERFIEFKIPGNSCPVEVDYLYRTGDKACWLADGNIKFLGRLDQQVKIRGFRVEPGEIETRLSGHEAVKEAVVTVGEEISGDKYLCAYIVAKPGQSSLEKNAGGTIDMTLLRNYLSRDLPGYMIPSYFVTLEQIPLTPN
ncbi:MAG: amino acid adenylation domain-containing protein, partial [bacterium]|nr:amino acid adenylation domain-containing protein [bacterium]